MAPQRCPQRQNSKTGRPYTLPGGPCLPICGHRLWQLCSKPLPPRQLETSAVALICKEEGPSDTNSYRLAHGPPSARSCASITSNRIISYFESQGRLALAQAGFSADRFVKFSIRLLCSMLLTIVIRDHMLPLYGSLLACWQPL